MTMLVPTQKAAHSGQAKPGRARSGPAGRGIGITPVAFSQVRAGRRVFLSAHDLAHQQLVTEESATTWVECDEVLIADPRGKLTPAQMVDQKLLALLGSCPRSFHPGLPAFFCDEESGPEHD
jgi:hypothetical protein